jgi:hypothetical protein
MAAAPHSIIETRYAQAFPTLAPAEIDRRRAEHRGPGREQRRAAPRRAVGEGTQVIAMVHAFLADAGDRPAAAVPPGGGPHG